MSGSWLELSLFHTSTRDRYVETAAASESSETESLSSGGKMEHANKGDATPVTR